MQVSRFAYLRPSGACLVLATSAVAQPAAPAGSGAAPAASALPAASNNGAVTSVVVSGGARALFKIAIAPPPGDAAVAGSIVETASRDLTLSSMFQVLDAKSFTANLEREGLAIDPASWRTSARRAS